MKKLSSLAIQKFQREIKNYYKTHKRLFAWRDTTNPYKILVSELMLQQTQTSRVAVKYKSFLKKFPTIGSLAKASIGDVLKEWQGLGYNRRALYLKKTAETVVSTYKGKFPQSYGDLLTLPGVGQSTAGALSAFAWNIPVPFIETNIRTVYLYFFFKDSSSIHDKDICNLLEQTIDKKNPRDWYYALYDYGAMLKSQNKKLRTLHQKSAHYVKQSKFEGSNRQARSHIIKTLLSSTPLSLSIVSLVKKTTYPKEIILKNLHTMQKEGLIMSDSNLWKIA